MYHINKYIESLMNFHNKSFIKDEITYLYEENKLKYNRIKNLNFLGTDLNIDFDINTYYDNNLFDDE